ncbi:hypothetical protein PMI26_05804 [Pseudomonas sp. GM33]|nr:hypothetical protein PMI26_05804 [Pseudomonas sp. GM33]
MPTGYVVILLIMDTPIGHPPGCIEAQAFKALGQRQRDDYLANEASFALNCVEQSRSPLEFFYTCRPGISDTLIGPTQS